MGLDITAHSRLRPVECADGENCWPKHVHVYRNEDFSEQAEGLRTGCYTQMEGSREHGFRAGSYSGYNWWRDELALLVGTSSRAIWSDPRPGPFVELVNFADNEGVIGPKTSAKLAADFAKYRDIASKRAGDGTMFWDKYQLWQAAFELASDGGCVRFH